ncbi:hypothetical protein A1A1_16515 [Planococcus antarcticus DSM 14505]|uniref:Uncharacterized protein n=1 Tax=Planococcus antarcticus DSM 14505 TaxID=1185653 RepID=A0A1C7DDW7_9BACL|nr:hypothetical protein [Planococcus antarcticus]ANU09644.1 hypothetical protein BBH88_04705 [Planococcus antarcticus DSM 14505]EIM05343.1 hypothetical protein A1A1_16515 [Planococcus antarcticus DSM 14505]
MPENQLVPLESITYFFTRSKDVHEENGTLFVTLFARLTREFTKSGGQKKVESVWVDIEEKKMEHATKQMMVLPNYIHRYNISKEVFWGLFKVSADCRKELYYVTPFSILK